MSTNNDSKNKGKLIILGLFLVLLGSLINGIRQVGVYFHTNRKLSQEEKQLKLLQEKNRALRVKLEEVKRPEFLDEQARKLLGIGSTGRISTSLVVKPSEGETVTEKKEQELPNYQQWWRLFLH